MPIKEVEPRTRTLTRRHKVRNLVINLIAALTVATIISIAICLIVLAIVTVINYPLSALLVLLVPVPRKWRDVAIQKIYGTRKSV